MKTTSLEDAVSLISDGSRLMIGGFMGAGTPERLIDELVRQKKRDLVVIANDTAEPGKGIGKLIGMGLVSRAIASHIGLNPETQRLMIANKMQVELVPQGTLVERIRAHGSGLAVFSRRRASVRLWKRASGNSKSTARATCSRRH